MKRFITIAFALTLVAGVAAGCGGDDSSESGSATTTAGTGSGSSDSGGSGSGGTGTSDTGNEKVDAYCNQVNELAATARTAVENKDSSLAGELEQQAQQLASDAAGLASEVVKDPSLASAIQQCSQEASEALQNLGSAMTGGAEMPDMGDVDDMMPDGNN
jgi:uncharacterized phage infection (PIP) family protein YhgE